MALNQSLFVALEGYGVTNSHLEMLVALCASGKNGAVTWHLRQGQPARFEIHLYGDMAGKSEIQHLIHLLER